MGTILYPKMLVTSDRAQRIKVLRKDVIGVKFIPSIYRLGVFRAVKHIVSLRILHHKAKLDLMVNVTGAAIPEPELGHWGGGVFCVLLIIWMVVRKQCSSH